MSGFDFDQSVKESNLVVKRDDTEHLLTCTSVEFLDKLVISVALNGETDVSYDIQMPSIDDLRKPLRKYDYGDNENDNGRDGQNDDGEEVPLEDEEADTLNSTIVPVLLIGAGHSVKSQVLASQLGLVLSQRMSKNVILNLSGKLFGNPKDETYNHEDSVVVQQVVQLVFNTI